MTEMDELKPCPFCGERLQRQQTSSGHWYEHMGEAEDCYATGSIVFDENIPAWNRRPSLSPAGVTDTEARAFAVAYAKACNHRYDMGAIRAGLEAAAKVRSPADAKGDLPRVVLPIMLQERYYGSEIQAMLDEWNAALPHNQGEGK